MKTKRTVLSLEQVSLRYGETTVLKDVTLEVHEGEVSSLLGPSGSGKTSALRLLMGLTAPSEGTVRMRGEVVSCAGKVMVPPEDRGLAVVFQSLALWPHLSVWENLAFGLRSQKVRGDDLADRITKVLGDVELEHKGARYPRELSGGEAQRVAIARALVLRPNAIIMDEPLSNLDIGLRDELTKRFTPLFAEYGATVLYVTHDPREAARLAERTIILESGQCVYTGAIKEVPRESPSPFVQLVARYLG